VRHPIGEGAYFDNMQNQLHDQWSMLLADDGIRLKCAIRDGMQYKIANIGRYVGTGDEHFFATLVDEPPNYTYKFYVSETWEHLSAAHKRAMCLMRVAWGKAHLVQTNLDNKFPQHAARAEELKAPATVHDELKAPATVRLATLLLHLGTLRLTLTSVCMRRPATMSCVNKATMKCTSSYKKFAVTTRS
jgi:hypothetical protein